MNDKTCTRCGETYDVAFFRNNDRAYAPARSGSRGVCLGCEQTARDTKKRKNRWLVKAQDTLRHHSRKFVERGIVESASVLVEHFGWDVRRMAHEAEHTYGNGCGYCGEPFSEMDHGLADITLDIVDPESPPHYGINTRWICQTCNRAKGRRPPGEWGAIRSMWEKWKRRVDSLAHDPNHGTLFEGTGWKL
jgi:hypothetical protein